MPYLIFTDQSEAEAYQAQVDEVLGYPESLDSLRYVGGGIHAPKELGRALHYAPLDKHQSEDQWALPKVATDNYISHQVPVLHSAYESEVVAAAAGMKDLEGRRILAPIEPTLPDVPETATEVEELPEGWRPALEIIP